MPSDPELAERVRRALASRSEVTEKRMFGGVSFLLRGSVACCVVPAGLLVRHDPEQADELLSRPEAAPFVMAGKSQRGWLVVEPSAVATARDLKRWVEIGAAYAAGLAAHR